MINFEELIKSVILPLVVYPQDFVITKEDKEDDALHYNIVVNKADVGRVIGKNGSIISAIRTIVYAGASKEGKKVFVNIDKSDIEE